jgi:hypothetical protein
VGTWILRSRSSSSRLAPALALGQQQHAVGRAVQVLLQRRQRLGGAAAHAHIGQRAGPVHRLAAAQGQRHGRRCGEELLDLQEAPGRQDGPLRVVLQEAVALARVGPEALQGLVHLAVQHQAGLRAR